MKEKIKELINVSKSLKMLYVEDDKETRFATLELMKSFFNEIEVADDGVQALHQYQKGGIDIIFTDISMPRMDGIELIEKIRQEDQNLPIVVLSAYNDNKYLMQAIKLGVDGYIVKPLELNQFLNILQKVVRKYQLEATEKETALLYERIGESIKFASAIQHSLIPSSDEFNAFFKDHFQIWEPRDMVGGDFYFFTRLNDDDCLIMLIDCTGHGVHGAFLTMLCEVIYRQLVSKLKNKHSHKISPAKILMHFNYALIDVLSKDGSDAMEGKGFDGQVVHISYKHKKIKFAGARNPLYYSDGEEIACLKGDNKSIGYNIEPGFKFTQSVVDMSEGMKLYIATDGFWDQMGGKKNLPFGKRRFKKLLEQNFHKPMQQQKKLYQGALQQYENEGSMKRIDDIAFLGLDLE
ncbi:MAG: response regulator [Campylobacterota bacterium]